MSINKSTAKSFETSSQVEAKQESKSKFDYDHIIAQLSSTLKALKELLDEGLEHTGKRAAGAVTVAALSAVALAGCSADAHANTKPTFSHSAEATPTPTATPEQEISVQSIELPTSLTPQQVGEKFFADDVTLWNMAGANKKNVDGYWDPNSKYGNDISGYTQPIVDANTEIFKEALFAPNVLLDNTTNIPTYVANMTKNNHARLEDYILTAHSDKPFRYWSTVEEKDITVLSKTDTTLSLEITSTEHNNVTPDDKVGSKYDPQELEINGYTTKSEVDFTVIDGTYKITNIK